MYSPHFRLWVQNESGQTQNVVVNHRGKKFDSNGELVYSAPAEIYNNGTLGTGAGSGGTAVNNTSNKELEGEIEITVVSPAGADGDVTVLLQRSLDGTTWPDDNAGDLASAIKVSGSGTFRRVVNIS